MVFLFQAAKSAGLSDGEIKDLLESYTSKKIKDKLKNSTQEALDNGVSFSLRLNRETRDIEH